MSTQDLLLLSLLGACLGVTGCRSAPPAEEPMAVEAKAAEVIDLDKKVAEAAVRMTRVERNGVVYFCKRSRQMGTNISSLKCMTESQLRVEVETMAQVRDDMRNKMGKCTSGRSGRGGPCGGY